MVYFNGIDLCSKRITVDFDYDFKKKDEIIKFVREKLGEEVTINEIANFIPELQDLKTPENDIY